MNLREAERVVRDRLVDWPRFAKQASMLIADAAGLISCVWLSAWLVLPVVVTVADFIPLVATTFLITALVARHLGFYHSIVRYLGIGLAVASIKVAIVSATTLAMVVYLSGLAGLPVRLTIVYGAFFGLYLVSSRYLAQYFLVRRNPGKECVIIYGAGEAGARVVAAMQSGDTYLPVAIIDDDPAMQDKMVSGLQVYSRGHLNLLIEKHGVSRVLLAMPSVSRSFRADIIATLEPLTIHVQTIPSFNDLVTGKAQVDDICDVEVEDLLGRESVPPDEELLKSTVAGKSVMVTGAGGSIGSELCRQIVKLGPKTLVLFEISEFALYQIDSDLQKLARKLGIDCDIVALLGSVHKQQRVQEVMQTFRVKTVYHAAAYKHVPVVEGNILEGVDNNVFGTLHSAQAAIESDVETFVLISTDKAVSPTNVMGATKRLSEMVLQAIQHKQSAIRFCMVRFGNVLESSGSVVPLFRDQIRAGGPVTVTHHDIIRYFMTIPEAAQLVIQAGAMASGGDVFVLDMGEPVRILDLAKRMIRLTGLTVRDDENPDGDIEIAFTGLRPAEKLYEELLIGSDVSGTRHPRIMRANEEFIQYQSLMPLLDDLGLASRQLDRVRVRQVLLQSVSGYKPKNDIDDLVWVGAKKSRAKSATEKVVRLTPLSK